MSVYNVKVKTFKNEKIDSLLRRFKKQVNNSNFMNIYKEKQEFTKPSVKKRIDKKKNTYNTRKYEKSLEI